MKAFMLLVTVYVTLSNCEDVPDICALTQESGSDNTMYCSCDSELFNKATEITCFIFGTFSPKDNIWKGFQRQQKIRSLKLSAREQNPLTFVPVDVLKLTPELKNCDIGNGDIRTLNSYTFSNMNDLETIDLTSNNISSISRHAFAYLPSLTKLTLGENGITKIQEHSFYELPELRRLYLDRNRIETIDDLSFLFLPKLQEIELFQNEIEEITSKTFVGLKSLHRLDISRNKLTKLEDELFMSMPQLRELDLSENQISAISPVAFQGLSHLRSLKLNLNRLTSLPGRVFIGAPDLMAVDLANNKITTLSERVLDGLTHSKNPQFTFQLKKNPLICSCELKWLGKFALEHETSTFLTGTGYQYVMCEVKHIVVGNWTEGEHLPITVLANNKDLKCSKKTTTPTTSLPSSTSALLTSQASKSSSSDMSPKQELHLATERKIVEKSGTLETEMSDEVAEGVTKAVVDVKTDKSSKRVSNGSVKGKFNLSVCTCIVYSLALAILGNALRHH